MSLYPGIINIKHSEGFACHIDEKRLLTKTNAGNLGTKQIRHLKGVAGGFLLSKTSINLLIINNASETNIHTFPIIIYINTIIDIPLR